jgi:hypothetical protein
LEFTAGNAQNISDPTGATYTVLNDDLTWYLPPELGACDAATLRTALQPNDGHAVDIIGYSLTVASTGGLDPFRSYFILLNNWGKDHGYGGYFTMSFAAFKLLATGVHTPGLVCGYNSAACRKHADGEVCVAGNECTSGTCGGRCCAAGKACTCTLPSTSNLVRNPGFDIDLTYAAPKAPHWQVVPPSASVKWSGPGDDFESCPFSGAAHFAVNDAVSSTLQQCVNVLSSTTYNFGVRMRTNGAGGTVSCWVDTFPQANCGGTSTRATQVNWINVDWGPLVGPTPIATGTGIHSVRVSCSLDGRGETGVTADVDFVHLTPTPGRF